MSYTAETSTTEAGEPQHSTDYLRLLAATRPRERALLRLISALERRHELLNHPLTQDAAQHAADHALIDWSTTIQSAAQEVTDRRADVDTFYGFTPDHLDDGLGLGDVLEDAESPAWPNHRTNGGHWCPWSNVTHSPHLTSCPNDCDTSTP